MFRKQTDQVYETLQQVQRSMSHYSEGGSSWAGNPQDQQTGAQGQASSPFEVGGQQVRTGSEASRQTLNKPVGSSYETQADVAAGHTTPGTSFILNKNGPAVGMHISMPLAATLFVFWLLTVGVAFRLGSMTTDSTENPLVGQAPNDAGDRVITPEKESLNPGVPGAPQQPSHSSRSQGPDYIVLASSASNGSSIRREYEKHRKALNDYAQKHPDRVQGELFGLRYPSSGGIQLIFGAQNDGTIGVDKSQYGKTYDFLVQKYKSASWR